MEPRPTLRWPLRLGPSRNRREGPMLDGPEPLCLSPTNHHIAETSVVPLLLQRFNNASPRPLRSPLDNGPTTWGSTLVTNAPMKN